MSQAPGLSGTPDPGHFSSAASSASCASSSARPTSRVIRARPATIFADSIRQTASIAPFATEWVAEGSTLAFPRLLLELFAQRGLARRCLLHVGRAILELLQLPDLHGVSVGHRAAPRPFDRFRL